MTQGLGRNFLPRHQQGTLKRILLEAFKRFQAILGAALPRHTPAGELLGRAQMLTPAQADSSSTESFSGPYKRSNTAHAPFLALLSVASMQENMAYVENSE